MGTTNYTGILISGRIHKKFPETEGRLGKTLSFYENAARKNNIKICYFRPSDIDFNNREVKGWVKSSHGYKLIKIHLPAVIFRRTSYGKKYDRLFSPLCNKGDLYLFNLRRFKHKKYDDYLFFHKNETLRKHLPETMKATPESIREMMEKYNQLIIKPNSGRVGKGIMKLEKSEGHWKFLYKKKQEKEIRWETIEFKNDLPSRLIKKMNKGSFLVQERINLATVSGCPFDMRVSVQKNCFGTWQISGIIAKLAERGHFITNLTQGGTSYPLSRLLEGHPSLSPGKVLHNLVPFVLLAADYLEKSYPFLADLGFDIGITPEGFPYIIELNTVSDYPTLTMQNNELGDQEWEKVFTTPIDFSAYLLNEKHCS